MGDCRGENTSRCKITTRVASGSFSITATRSSASLARDGRPEEHENLLAVSQVLAGLRYNDPKLFQILGGREAMIESPVLQQLKAEWTYEAHRKDVIKFLVARFGDEAKGLRAKLDMIDDEARLEELVEAAGTSPDLEAFRKHLEA